MGDRLAGVAFVLLGGYVAAVALGLDVGTWLRPGPGFFPLGVGLTMVVLGGVIASRPGRYPREALEVPGVTRLVKAGMLLAAYVLALPYVGFILTTFVFILAWLRLVTVSRWGEAVVAAALGTAVAHGIFVRWLALPLPPGVLAR